MILKKTYHTLLLYLLVMSIVLVYSATLTAELLTWNDDSMISAVSALQNGNTSVWSYNDIRPIPLMIFSFFYSFGNGSIFLFHLANIIFHAFNAILLFTLLIRSRQSFPVSFFTAALFGLHTMQTGTVSWISHFPIILSLTILLLTAHVFIHYRRTKKRTYYGVVIILAMLFHLTVNGGFLFLVVLFGIDYFEENKISYRMVYQKIPFMLFSIISIIISKISLVQIYNDSVQFIRFGIVEGFVKIVTLVHSSGVTPLQEIADKNIMFGYSLYPLLVPFIIFSVLWFRKTHNVLLFSFIGFIIFGLPVVSCVGGGEWVLNSEKYYISSMFLIFPLSYYVYGYIKNTLNGSVVRITVISFSILLFGFIVVQSYRSVTFRRTNLSFWTYLNNDYPGNAFILNKIGTYHLSRYESEQAISKFSQAINLHPRHYESYNNRGLAYLSIYQTDSASADFSRAITIFPQYALAYYNLSTVYSLLSDWNNAVLNCSKAIDLQPDLVQAYNNRANTYARQKKYVEAFADYETAVRIEPGYSDIYGNRALIYLETGNVTHALWNFKKQSNLVPKRFDVFVHLGLTYAMTGDTSQAFTVLSEAIRLDSANAKMYLLGIQETFLRDRRDIGLLKNILLRLESGQK